MKVFDDNEQHDDNDQHDAGPFCYYPHKHWDAIMLIICFSVHRKHDTPKNERVGSFCRFQLFPRFKKMIVMIDMIDMIDMTVMMR